MTVQELIERLMVLPLDLDVWVGEYGTRIPATGVEMTPFDFTEPVVVID